MILLTDEEILRAIADGVEVKDGVEMRVLYAKSIAKAQLKKVVEWAIEKRRELTYKRKHQKEIKPEDIHSQIVLGSKIKAFQQVIDKCGLALLEEVK